MPMGMTHRQINTWLNIPLGAGALAIGWEPGNVAIMLVGYNFATYFMNPDLDLNSHGYQSWGWLRFLWWPYQKALAHRSWMSHFPVISTILRIIYLLWFPVLLTILLWGSMELTTQQNILKTLKFSWLYLIIFVIGMIISDSLHAILDTVSTELKTFFRRKQRRKQKRGENFLAHHHEYQRRRSRSKARR